MALFGKKPKSNSDPVIPPPPRPADFLGNPVISSADALAHPEENPSYRNGFLPVTLVTRMFVASSILVVALAILLVVLLVRENSKVQTQPQVFMQTEIGKLVQVPTVNAEVSVPLLESFLNHIVSNATAVRNGELTNLEYVKGLIDERALNEIVNPLIAMVPRMRADKVSISHSVNRIDVSSPERFVINRRFKRSFGVAYGTVLTVTGNGGGKTRDTRWDFEIIFVPRTAENGWGLFAVQLKEKTLNMPLPTIPPDLRRAEDLIRSN